MAEAYENVIREMFGDKPTLADDLMAVVKARMQTECVSDITIATQLIAELTQYRDAATAQRDRSLADWERMDNGDVVALDDVLDRHRVRDAERPSGT